MSPTLIFSSFIIAAYLPSLQPFSNPVMKQLLLVKKVQTGSTHRPLGIQSILRCFYNFPSIPSDSFFQDPTLKPQTRIMLLKTQYQKVWFFSWFSHGGLPVPLDQYNLLKTFFPLFYCCWIWFKRGPSVPATSSGELCTSTQLLRFLFPCRSWNFFMYPLGTEIM